MKENQNIEWKQSWHDEYLKWICGFANAEGGVLVIGRNDRGAVVGLKDVPRLLEEPDQTLLEKLHLVEGRYLTHAAVLMFHPEPERFFTGAYMKIGFFESDADLRYQDEVQGDLVTQVNQTIEVLKAKYLRAWITYEGLQRIETWPVPMPALREAVLNAVVHKDYTSGAPIQISVYPDKLMIWNPGELPPEWTVEKLLGKHASIPFNPDVANVFFRTGMIESWGRGIERIIEACRTADVPAPELRYEHTGLWVIFHFTQANEVKTPERILEVLGGNPGMTLAEVASVIGKSLSAVERASARLVKKGRLRYVGPRKGGYWEILK